MKVCHRLFVVLPAHNEEESIHKAAHAFASAGLAAARAHDDVEMGGVVVVDDGSTDGTWEILRGLSQRWTFLCEFVAIRLSRNFGKEAAILAGLAHALRLGADLLVVADADLQHPPELLPKMLAKMKEHQADVVEAVKHKRGKESFARRAAAKLFYRAMRQLSGLEMESASDYRLLTRRAAQAVVAMPERTVFFRGMSTWVGFRRAQVVFDVRERKSGTSSWNTFKLIGLAARAITAYSAAPLRVVSFFGLLFLAFAAVMALQTLWKYWTGQAVTGFATVILLILISSSIIMISLGVIGEYLARVFDEVKARPRYIVDETVSWKGRISRSSCGSKAESTGANDGRTKEKGASKRDA